MAAGGQELAMSAMVYNRCVPWLTPVCSLTLQPLQRDWCARLGDTLSKSVPEMASNGTPLSDGRSSAGLGASPGGALGSSQGVGPAGRAAGPGVDQGVSPVDQGIGSGVLTSSSTVSPATQLGLGLGSGQVRVSSQWEGEVVRARARVRVRVGVSTGRAGGGARRRAPRW